MQTCTSGPSEYVCTDPKPPAHAKLTVGSLGNICYSTEEGDWATEEYKAALKSSCSSKAGKAGKLK